MNWPFRRRGGNPTGSGQQPAAPQPAAPGGPAAAAPPSEPAAWRRLPPLAGPLTAPAAQGLTAPPVADRTLRAAGTMLATAAPSAGGEKPSEVPAGRVEGLAKAVPLRHVQPRRTPETGLAETPALPRLGSPVQGRTGDAAASAAVLPAADLPAPELPAAPAVRQVPVVRTPEPPAQDLTRVTEGSVGEPRRATESTHPPAWMNAGAVGSATDLASLLFPQAGDLPSPFFDTPAASVPDPAARAEPTAREHLVRRNLGQSRRLGLGAALSHTPHPDPAALGEEDGRPPPAALLHPLPVSEPDPAPAGPPPTPAEHRTELPAPPATAPDPAPHQGADPAGRGGPAAADGPPRPPLHHRAATPAATAPADLARAVSNLHGIDVTGTTLHTGAQATSMAQDMSAKAFTKNAEVYLPDTAASMDSARTRGLIAHELTHVAQQKRYGNNLPPENSPAGRALEAEAVSAERHFRGDPGAPAPLVHRKPVTDTPDPEEIRRLITQMAPATPPPAPPPPPAPEPEPQAAAPVSEPAFSGLPEMSWTPETGLVDGVQRASRDTVVEEYLAELNHATRHDTGHRSNLTSDDLTTQQHQEMIDFRLKHFLAQGTREDVIVQFLAERNYEQRHTRGDGPLLTAADLQTDPALKDAIEFRLSEAARTGRLTSDDDDDDIGPERDIHWLKGQVGLNLAQGLASQFGINMDRKRRDAVREFFGGRRPAEDEDGDEAPLPPPFRNPVPARPPQPSAPGAGRSATGLQKSSLPAASAQESVKEAGGHTGPQGFGTGAEQQKNGLRPPWASQLPPVAHVTGGDDEDGDGSDSTTGTGLDVWKEVKSSLWTAATAGFLHPSEKEEPEEKDEVDFTTAFRANALKEDQVTDLAERVYPRVRELWSSAQRLDDAARRDRFGYTY
ncbi:DUF4157 domain-containing protein [Streptomyces sp. NBC_00096]|uniref:eCIS core domain-containing protein n=1 Tax=Streptomyces sp. NBC_00096 TaxID=2975650 RepID=UPI0032492A57